MLSQFPDVEFNQITLPFIDDDDKVAKAIRQIDEVADSEGHRSLVFATFVNRQYLTRLMTAKAKVLDFFDAFVGPLELELGVPPAWRRLLGPRSRWARDSTRAAYPGMARASRTPGPGRP